MSLIVYRQSCNDFTDNFATPPGDMFATASPTSLQSDRPMGDGATASTRNLTPTDVRIRGRRIHRALASWRSPSDPAPSQPAPSDPAPLQSGMQNGSPNAHRSLPGPRPLADPSGVHDLGQRRAARHPIRQRGNPDRRVLPAAVGRFEPLAGQRGARPGPCRVRHRGPAQLLQRPWHEAALRRVDRRGQQGVGRDSQVLGQRKLREFRRRTGRGAR